MLRISCSVLPVLISLLAGVANAGIIDSSGAVVVVAPPPSVDLHIYESDFQMRAFYEKQNVVLGSDVAVNVTQPGTYTDVGDLTPGYVAEGTPVRSYYVHVDPVDSHYIELSGSLTFDTDVLGLILRGNELNDSHALLGLPDTVYPSGFGYEFFFGEQITLSQDGRTLSLFCTSDGGIDNLRIVTAIPEPASLALLGLGGLVMLTRRQLCERPSAGRARPTWLSNDGNEWYHRRRQLGGT